MRCPSCMAENAATRRFCAQCGTMLPSPCPAFGFENRAEPGIGEAGIATALPEKLHQRVPSYR
jgi:zinc-ribbon domain